MRAVAKLWTRVEEGVCAGPWVGLRIGRNGLDHTPSYLLFDAHAQHLPVYGFGAGLVFVLRVRNRLIVRFGRNWGRAYR